MAEARVLLVVGGAALAYGLTELMLAFLIVSADDSVQRATRQLYLRRSPFFIAIGLALLVFWILLPR